MQDAKLLKNIAATIAQIYFFNHDLQPAFCCFDKSETVWISLAGDMIRGYDNVIDFVRKHRERDPECRLTDETYHIQSFDDTHAILIGNYTFDMLTAMDSIFYIRMTYCFIKREDGWKIVHVHASSPSYSSYLDKRVRQIELASQTVTIGLKGTLNDEKHTFTYVNDEIPKKLGYTREEFMEMSGRTSVGSIYPPDVSKYCETIKQRFEEADDYRTEYRIPKKDGTLLWVMEYGKKISDMDGNTQIHSAVVDITDIKNAMSELEIEKERNEIVAELSEDIIFDYNTKKDTLEIVYPSSMCCGTHKKKVFENYLKQYRWKEIQVCEDDHTRFAKRILQKALWAEHPGTVRDEFHYETSADNTSWKRVLVRSILDSDGEIVRIVGKVFDITSEKKLLLRSTTDALTGVYNRTYLEEEIKRYLTEKNNDLNYACMLIDIDYFKKVNDKYGHLHGDLILQKVAAALKNIAHETDIVARLGGDEFVVFLEDIYDPIIVEEMAKRLLTQAKNHSIRESAEDKLSLSIGISISDKKDMDINMLYHQADVALYNAKELGRGRCMVYTENMEHPRSER